MLSRDKKTLFCVVNTAGLHQVNKLLMKTSRLGSQKTQSSGTKRQRGRHQRPKDGIALQFRLPGRAPKRSISVPGPPQPRWAARCRRSGGTASGRAARAPDADAATCRPEPGTRPPPRVSLCPWARPPRHSRGPAATQPHRR